jgi:hypothetical protein
MNFKSIIHNVVLLVLISISQSTRDYTEHAHRTQPTVADLTLALIDNRIEFDEIQVSLHISPTGCLVTCF